MEFRRDLGNEMVALFKVITGRDDPSLPEALITVNLEGKVQLVRLTKIQSMTEEQKKMDECLLDLKVMLDDPHLVKVIENVADVIKFGERVHHEWVAESFLTLEEWTPELRPGFFPTIKQGYHGKYDKLVAPFRGKGTPGWAWESRLVSEELSPEQGCLIYALSRLDGGSSPGWDCAASIWDAGKKVAGQSDGSPNPQGLE